MKGGTLSLYRDPQRLIRDERHFVSTWWRIVLCQHMDAYGPLPKHFFWQISYPYAYRLGVPNLPKMSRKSNICFCNFSADDMQKRDLDMHNHNLWRNVTHFYLDVIVLQSYSISGMFWVMSGPFLLEIDLAQCKYISSLVWHWWLALKAVPPECLHPCNDLRSEPPHLPVHSGPHPAIHNHRYTNSFQAVWSMSSCLSLATQAASDVFETFWNLMACVLLPCIYIYIYIYSISYHISFIYPSKIEHQNHSTKFCRPIFPTYHGLAGTLYKSLPPSESTTSLKSFCLCHFWFKKNCPPPPNHGLFRPFKFQGEKMGFSGHIYILQLQKGYILHPCCQGT